MAHAVARMLLFGTLLVLSFALVGGPTPGPAAPHPAEPAPPPQPLAGRVVFVCNDLSPDQFVTLSAAAAALPEGVVLLDSTRTDASARAFLAEFRPDRVIPVGSFPDGVADLQRRLGLAVAPPMAWERGPPEELWRLVLPRADSVVVCLAEPRGLLLQCACLAGAAGAPLYVVRGADDEAAFRRWAAAWCPGTICAAGAAAPCCRDLGKARVIELSGEDEVATAYLHQLRRQGPILNLVVANPADVKGGPAAMSVLAPWVALHRHAALVLTNDAGDNVEAAVQAAIDRHGLADADALLLVANLKAVPMLQRPNPISNSKDKVIDLEPFTPAGSEPYTFAIGRLFHDDPAVVTALLARQRLLAEGPPRRRALVVSNSGGSLPLLETFSRNTAQELRNTGFETTALFGKQVSPDKLRRLLPEHDLFLWEGHHNTLINDWSFPQWDEPLPPSLAFLQSCLALHEWKALPLLQRGAVGVVGSSTRIYSASGGACSLAFFDALLYDDQSVGGALRQAKNFLAAYAQLKEKRLGKDAKRTAANLRSAWAFTLWGDPTLRLPLPERPANALPAVRHEVRGNTVVVTLPEAALDAVYTTRYQAEMLPNERLAGLVRRELDEDAAPLVPFVFAEVRLDGGPAGTVPHLKGRLPSSHWVFSWDARRSCGYLLLMPRTQDRGELRFHVEWAPAEEPQVTARNP